VFLPEQLSAILPGMDKRELVSYLERLDAALSAPSELYIYGSAVVILLDAPGRTSLDIDVAGPYSSVQPTEFARASEAAGLPVNPDDPAYSGNHLEWVGPLRLCLPPPDGSGMTLWRGMRLTVRTGNAADIIASKLIRYDETDKADIQFLCTQAPVTMDAVRAAADALPAPFRDDALVRENLGNLAVDLLLWRGLA
jgi:hypothetical protein